jgi:hypothetical protein
MNGKNNKSSSRTKEELTHYVIKCSAFNTEQEIPPQKKKLWPISRKKESIKTVSVEPLDKNFN